MAVSYKDLGLVNTKEMFAKAMKGHYAIPAYNFNNMEQLQAIIQACVETESPVILQVSKGAREYANQTLLRYLAQGAVEYAKEISGGKGIPICLHLDHGPDFETCKSCIDMGFSSVMIDGSHLPYEQNIIETRKVVEYAHKFDVTVEGELGVLAGIEDDVKAEKHTYTRPEEVEDFVKRTGVDSLAIAIGTSHGAYKFKGDAKLDFDRLEAIGKLLPDYPLVLHGASSVPQEFVALCNKYGGNVAGAKGVPEEMLRKAAGMSVCKINVDTDIRLAVTASIRQHMAEHPEDFDPRAYLKPARAAVKAMVAHKIRNVMGSSGKA